MFVSILEEQISFGPVSHRDRQPPTVGHHRSVIAPLVEARAA